MKTTSTLAAAVATCLLLCSCTLSIESHHDSTLVQEQVMAICGMGVIQTPDGPRPAISESGMPVEAYRSYTDCVQKITARQAHAAKAADASGATPPAKQPS